ncbi:hypothetical protein N0V83_002319 [Neocucurbitaria cava]|uniref:H/ACA ribonucleoprotein complex non-core subunit NAF1 n=1 Tax=Neocucurbitaria cava TaxID=798079 RepID=A0A9W9CQP4_9PLEO|nr:hypothetical protein N0V83_002319 [Neocucurbitaria cava]
MSDSLEPPAKRARLEADAPVYGAPATALDAPGSPVDDMDDDFYDTTPVKPAAPPAADGATSLFAAAATAPASFHLPGLGSVSENQAAQPAAQASADAHPDETPEDGELSDDEALYDDGTVVEQPVANQEEALGEAPQHGKPSSRLKLVHRVQYLTSVKDAAAVPHPAPDSDDGALDAALAAAIDAQTSAQDAVEDLSVAGGSGTAEIASKAEFLRAAEANKDNKDAEWQLDSDASDSDSSSDSSSNDSSDEGSDEGELLDPEEQVRLLMAEAADEPGANGKAKVKTLNEVEEQYEKPDITVAEDTKITELGKVESVVENLVLIKANVSGDYQVLESGSALCLQNRTVIGKVSEQIGRVEEPRYAVGFNDATEIETLGLAKDMPIYYVDEHTTFVFTEPLRAQKHTDASNLHDEETNEVEFSDDEKEAEYKREQKAKKRARAEENEDRPNLPIPTGPRGHVDKPVVYQSMEYQGGGLKYSDDEDEDLGMYKPLARPDHFEQIVGHGAPLEDRSHVRRGMMRGKGPWSDRGRGLRGRGAYGGRGDFGGNRGDKTGYGGGRGDFGGGRGDRGGFTQRGDKGGHGNNRGDRGGGGRGGRVFNAPSDRGGRHQDQFHDRQHDRQQDLRARNGPQYDNRSATSASPARQQQDRGHSQPHQLHKPQQSPPKSGKNKNRKQRQREKREREREQQQQQNQQHQHQQQQQQQQGQHQKQHSSPVPSAPSSTRNANAYANNSSAGWPAPYSAPSQPAATYTQAPPPPPATGAAAYANPAAYAPQPPAHSQLDQQANMAAWAQWFQVVGAMSQQQAPQLQAQPQPQAPPQLPPQPQAQYAYPYQQYGQNAAPPPANPQQQANAQAGAQSLQDILRALGGGGGSA